jgi:hypothetical protein
VYLFLIKNWKVLALAGVLAYAVLMTALWDGEKDGRETDRLAYAVGTAKAETAFVKFKYDTEKKYQEKSDETDRNAYARIDEFRASFLQYAAANKAGQPFVIQTSGGGTKGADGPSSSAVVPITTQDGLICAENTARLLEAHKWAIELNK